MFRKIFSTLLTCTLLILTGFAQTAVVPETTRAKLTGADFYKIEPPKTDFEKESFKSQKQENKPPSRKKMALLLGLFAAGVVTVVILATRKGDNDRNL